MDRRSDEKAKLTMMARFTDNARAAIGRAFRRQPAADTRVVLNVLVSQKRTLAARLLAAAGLEVEGFGGDSTAVGRLELVKKAAEEAQDAW